MAVSPPKAVAFDVIGTLFSLEPLRGVLEGAGMPGEAMETLFAETLRDAFALAATGAFQPFSEVMDANLATLLQRHGVALAGVTRKLAAAAMRDLPPYPDATEALATLGSAGIPVLALSNGSAEATEALLRGAGLGGAVALVVSVDEVNLAKPRPEVYRHAAQRAGIEPGRLALVAAHPWDVQGAKSAGLVAGFVARGRAFPSVMAAPDVQGETLAEVAGKLAGTG